MQKVEQINHERRSDCEKLTYIAAKPRMALYLEYSKRIYQIYLRYVAPEDIHVYSIDEVFMDVTNYLHTYKMTARELAKKMIGDVLRETGITATAGIGTNLYLCKIAMDIEAKHAPADDDGVRIAELDEMSYRRSLWSHRPLTDFWRVGKGYAKKLEANGLFTMGDIARCSLGGEKEFHNEDLLYKLFGVNAELLIDHAWGYEPVTLQDIKAYRPEMNSVSTGQVLQSPYSYEKASIIVREMTELLVLDLVQKSLMTDQMVLTIGYDIENLKDPNRKDAYRGDVVTDRYGRQIPKHAHGTVNLDGYTSSTTEIVEKVMELYSRIMDESLLVRRINVVANHVLEKKKAAEKTQFRQMDLLKDFHLEAGTQKNGMAMCNRVQDDEMKRDKEKRLQQAMLDIRGKYGKNAILKGTDFEDGATTRQRNEQIGGHHA